MFFPGSFDLPMAREAGALVVQAYEQFQHVHAGEAWSLQGNYDFLGSFEADPPGLLSHTEPFGFVARNRTSGLTFVTFRGTQTLEDWFSNISFPQVPHSWGKAEEGFAKLYAQCADKVHAGVRSAGAQSRVVTTGHSLGSALATLAAADLIQSGVIPTTEMYNFASPRVGDRAFVAEFNRRIPQAWRIVNTEDIVTTVPIATPVLSGGRPHTALAGILRLLHQLDYAHVGSPIDFTLHGGSIAANHDMNTYISALPPG